MSGVRAKCRRGVGRALSEAVCRILTPPSSWSVGDGGFFRRAEVNEPAQHLARLVWYDDKTTLSAYVFQTYDPTGHDRAVPQQ